MVRTAAFAPRKMQASGTGAGAWRRNCMGSAMRVNAE
jgi:hypothetical protein